MRYCILSKISLISLILSKFTFFIEPYDAGHYFDFDDENARLTKNELEPMMEIGKICMQPHDSARIVELLANYGNLEFESK